jgi:fatty-acid desaturase
MPGGIASVPRALYATQARRGEFKVGYFLIVVAVHSLAAAAPWCFTDPGLVAFLVLYFLTSQLVINLGYHRLLSHQRFRVHLIVERCIALLGTLALQGGPISWVGNHRYHHKEADHSLDPHTPLAGLAWAHFLWKFYTHPELPDLDHRSRYARRLARDPFLRFCERKSEALNVLQVGGLIAAGWLAEGPRLALSLLVWGWALRIAVIWHMTFVVNSVNHRWGYRSYETRDNSRNNIWISILVFGEGWHNNHHADPRSAAHGHRRFEFDLGYVIIALMEWTGLAWRVIRPGTGADKTIPEERQGTRVALGLSRRVRPATTVEAGQRSASST